jgi:3-deoxy-D-manno-octulosonic-acid transferase
MGEWAAFEFEQGRPLIEAFKIRYPEYAIVLTFFSPSGYEVKKNYPVADFIFYLPLDSASNARKFIELIQPQQVFFIKYEFWFYYLKELSVRNIPVYIVSAKFRPEQLFFKWYGGFYKSILKYVSHFFVQNKESLTLLKTIGLNTATITGDTRFDRVYTLVHQKKQIPLLPEFKDNHTIFIAGSSWPKDHVLLIALIAHTKESNLKFILAPHEIINSEIKSLTKKLTEHGITSLKYSEANPITINKAQVLIIDSIGMLSSLYQYAEIAYIGGGFDKGIHNILEPATYGLPILFGPKYKKFKEAIDLINLKGAFCINTIKELEQQVQTFVSNEAILKDCANLCASYTASNRGATNTIMNYLDKENVNHAS